jgi:crossover junction endodeoxyribonuclease RuvC
LFLLSSKRIFSKEKKGRENFLVGSAIFAGMWYNKKEYSLEWGRSEFMVILGIDPGYAIVGYGVVDFTAGRYRPMEHGAIVTKAGQPFPRRLEIIADAMTSVLEKYRIDAVSIEKLYFQNNKTTAIQVAEARGVILLCCQRAGVEVFEYTPLQVKSAVTGYGQAKKPQVMEMTRRLLCLKEIPKPDDTADALALAICHGHAAGSHLRQQLLRGGTLR